MPVEAINEASPGVLGTLGINWRLFIAQLINFVVVLLVLWRWAWKPLVKILDERSRRIEQSLAYAKEIEEEMRRLGEKRTAALRETEARAQAAIADARALAEIERQETLAHTRTEVEKTLREAKESIRTEKTRMLAEARAELADVVIAATGKVLEREIDEKSDRAFVQKVLEKI